MLARAILATSSPKVSDTPRKIADWRPSGAFADVLEWPPLVGSITSGIGCEIVAPEATPGCVVLATSGG
jgi:hypothetical protein